MKAAIELTHTGLTQALAGVRENVPEEDGKFNIEVQADGMVLNIEGDLDITYNEYRSNNWYDGGYNDYNDEIGRDLLGFDVRVDTPYDIYDNDQNTIELYLTDWQQELISNIIKKVA